MRLMRFIVLGLVLAAAGSCTSTANLPFCPDDPKAYGDGAFLSQTGRRQDARTIVLNFTLRTTRNERFSRTPTVETYLGELVDAQAGGVNLQLSVLLPEPGSIEGQLTLRGTISGEFQSADGTGERVDRCPFEQDFNVVVGQSEVEVTQNAAH